MAENCAKTTTSCSIPVEDPFLLYSLLISESGYFGPFNEDFTTFAMADFNSSRKELMVDDDGGFIRLNESYLFPLNNIIFTFLFMLLWILSITFNLYAENVEIKKDLCIACAFHIPVQNFELDYSMKDEWCVMNKI